MFDWLIKLLGGKTKDQYDTAVFRYIQEIDKYQDDLAEQKVKADKLTQENGDLKNNIVKLTNENKTVQDNLNKALDTIKDLQNQISDLKDLIKDLQDQLNNPTKELVFNKTDILPETKITTYASEKDCPKPNIKIGIDNMIRYAKVGEPSDKNATNFTFKEDGKDKAILKSAD